jgi:hypothetical protein
LVSSLIAWAGMGSLHLRVRTLDKNIRLNTTPPSRTELKACKRRIIIKTGETADIWKASVQEGKAAKIESEGKTSGCRVLLSENSN